MCHSLIKQIFFLLLCVYTFYGSQKQREIIFLNLFWWFFYVMGTNCVQCEVKTET